MKGSSSSEGLQFDIFMGKVRLGLVVVYNSHISVDTSVNCKSLSSISEDF